MDYRITDGYLDPPGETEHLHTEALCRLRHHTCFRPSPHSPAVNALPAATTGRLTFGSVNQWPKVTDEVKDVWADLLRRVRGSRLLIVARGGQNAQFRDRIIGDFVSRGIAAARIQVVPAGDLVSFLELFGEIDIALDPFPYGGGTTTMQSLWMGVPVVTLRGATAFARNSVGPLTEAGLPHLVASAPDEYVSIAAACAQDVARLATTRSELRTSVAASRLMDGRGFSDDLGSAYRKMWRRHCGAQAEPLDRPPQQDGCAG
jgi:protein O-GlcNAc transferase